MSAGRSLAGRYRLSGELGRGGMGTVWRARDEKLDRDVAVKELALPRGIGKTGRDLAVRRALREARAAARLRHPGIVTVHDVVLEDGRPWIVMELLPGRPLDEVVARDGPMEPRRAAALGVGMLDALRAAHAHGVLHRDVKPANVFLRDDGRAVLTDFGIASLAGDAPLTRPGSLVGSPAYMAPERIRGEPGAPPSDLWSLGATLYALVEGRPPFDRSTPMGMLGAVLADDPAPPRLAGPLAGPLLRLLAKDPAARPDAAEMRAELTGIAGGGAPVTAPPEDGAEPRARRRGRTVAIALAVLACLVAATVTGFTLLRKDRYDGPAPYTGVPPLCGLISVHLMNRLVPHAGLGGDPSDEPNDYFNMYAHPGTQSCSWNERNYLLHGHSADITTVPVKAGPAADPMRPARAAFARLRRAGGGMPMYPGDPRSAPVRLPGVGDEAFLFDQAEGEAGMYREFDAVVILRTRNLVTQVRYVWYKHGAPPPGGVGRLRNGASQISRWIAAAFRTGRPVNGP
ncbi:MAG TPA: serine/threonine-protein kinase [Streptosporangiaceae bacterium]|jgi:hypothetical protein